MIKTVIKALEGFEKQFEDINEMKAKLDEDKAYAKELALAKVDEDFAERERKINSILEVMSVTEEIEVPDEPVAEEESVVSEDIDVEEIPSEEVPAEE